MVEFLVWIDFRNSVATAQVTLAFDNEINMKSWNTTQTEARFST